jgi:hypothetical protein
VTALIGAGGFTTYSFLGTSNNGGAATPEEAVTAFVSAAEQEDVLGMIDVTLPEEVAVLRTAIDSVVDDAKRIDVLDAGFDSRGVQGVDISVDDLALETNSTKAAWPACGRPTVLSVFRSILRSFRSARSCALRSLTHWLIRWAPAARRCNLGQTSRSHSS